VFFTDRAADQQQHATRNNTLSDGTDATLARISSEVVTEVGTVTPFNDFEALLKTDSSGAWIKHGSVGWFCGRRTTCVTSYRG